MSEQTKDSHVICTCNGRCLGLGDACGSSDKGYCCTLDAGHDGDHVACGLITHDMHAWKNHGKGALKA